jgi:hypothetical protein
MVLMRWLGYSGRFESETWDVHFDDDDRLTMSYQHRGIASNEVPTIRARGEQC